MTITPGENQKVGTVNNCSCSFFTTNHSACKHMFLVARRTRFRVSERVDELDTQRSGSNSYTPSTHAEGGGDSQLDNYSQPSPSTHTPETNIEHQQPPFPQASTVAQTAMASIPETSQTNLGDFSLQSYLDMMRGNPHSRTAPVNVLQPSAYQPHNQLMLQSNTHIQYRGNHYPDHRIFSSNPHLTSTPLDPATVPAEALDVYWENSSK